MKNLALILLFMFAINYIQAQTWVDVTQQYIQNPSFEEFTSCPTSNSNYPFEMWVDSVIGWQTPTAGTSDYYNNCNTTLNGVPSNWTGNNVPSFDGVAYCGFLAYSVWNDAMWSEYIQTKLLQPLKANTSYQFTMRIKRSNGFNFAVQNIGANFTENANNNFTTTKPYNLTPTVINTTGFLTDTLGWTLVSGEFTATGNENYLTIGWFGDTISSDFIFFIPPYIDTTNGDSLYLTETYYFVDSLTLSKQTFDIENFNINVITPNTDGSNDFLDFSVYDLQEFSFTVFNRWGNQVFNSDDVGLKWDGKNKQNKQLSDGTYFYILNATTNTGKQIIKHKSIIILY